MPHCDTTPDTATASTNRDDLLRRAFGGFAFCLFSVLAGLLVVAAYAANAIR